MSKKVIKEKILKSYFKKKPGERKGASLHKRLVNEVVDEFIKEHGEKEAKRRLYMHYGVKK